MQDEQLSMWKQEKALGILGLDSALGGRSWSRPYGAEPRGLVEPGESVIISTQPQRPFKGTRVLVGAVCAPYFIIERAYVGVESLFLNCDPVPAEAFATRGDLLPLVVAAYEASGVVCIELKPSTHVSLVDDAMVGAALSLPLATPGISVGMQVQNISESPRRFIAGIFGETVR